MKLIFAIVRDSDTARMLPELLSREFRVTRIASTGGWLHEGNTTFLIGAEEDQVDEALGIVSKHSSAPADPKGARSTVFVVGNVRYQQL
jgi:uncharacterized protein YaaQ